MAQYYTSFWIAPQDGEGPQTVTEAAQRAIKATPYKHLPGLILPTLYGPWWQTEGLSQNLGDLAVSGPEDVAQIRYEVEAEGVAFGVFAVPRWLTPEEALKHAQAGNAGGLLVLDLEPYNGFLADNEQDPQEYLTTLKANLNPGVGLDISLVPQASGLEPIVFLPNWVAAADNLRTQNYWNEQPALQPGSANIYLKRHLKAVGYKKAVKIIPIVPHPSVFPPASTYIVGRRGHTDVWRCL